MGVCDGCDETKQKAIHDALEPLAKRYIADAKSKDDDPECIFILAKGGGPIEQLKALTKKEAGDAYEKAGDNPVMLLFDIPSDGAFYIAETNEITTESVEAFLKNRGDRKQLSRG